MKETSSSKSRARDEARDTGNRQSFSLMYGLSLGHGMKHFGQGALPVSYTHLTLPTNREV